jgi:hypothetical protein
MRAAIRAMRIVQTSSTSTPSILTRTVIYRAVLGPEEHWLDRVVGVLKPPGRQFRRPLRPLFLDIRRAYSQNPPDVFPF